MRRIRAAAVILGLVLGTGVPPAAAAIDEFWTADSAARAKASATAEALLPKAAAARAAEVRTIWGRGHGDPVYVAVAALEDPGRTSAAVALVAEILAAAPADAPEVTALRPYAEASPDVVREAARLATLKSIREALAGGRSEGADELERRAVAVAEGAPAASLAAIEALFHAGRAATHRRDVASARSRWLAAATRARAIGWHRAALENAVRAGRAAIEAGESDAALSELRAAIDGPLGDRSSTSAYLARHDLLGILLARRDWPALLDTATAYEGWVRTRQPESSSAPFAFARARGALGVGRLAEAADAGDAAVAEGLRRGHAGAAARFAVDLCQRLNLAGRPADALRIGERLRGAPNVPDALALDHEITMIGILLRFPGSAEFGARIDAALARARAAGHRVGVRILQGVRAALDQREGRLDAALTTLLAIEADQAARSDRRTALGDRVRVTTLAVEMGRWDLVDARIDGLVAEPLAASDVASRARIDTLHAEVLAHREDDPGAVAAFDRAVEATRIARDRFLGSALLARARHHLRRGRAALALADAVGTAEARLAESAGLFEEDDWRTGADTPPELGLGAAAADALGKDPATARAAAQGVHRLLDAVRGRTLRRVVLGGDSTPPALPLELAAAERSSAAALAAARAALEDAEAGSAAGRAVLVARLAGTLAQRDEVLATIRRTGGLAAFGLEPAPASLEDVQEALGDGTAFVAWHAAPDAAGALVVRRTAAAWIPLPDARNPDALRQLVQWSRALSNGARAEPELARTTARAWFAPLAGALAGARTLLVSLDPRMGPLPVDAWVDPAAPHETRLVSRFAVANVPGAGAWLALRRAAPGATSGVLGIGRPLPAPAGFPDLPESEREARDVVSTAAPVERTLLTGESATLQRVTDALASKPGAWRWIHVAAHGIPDAVRPRSGGVLLARGERLDGDFLFRTRVPAAVVVLSSCEGAADDAAAAEGPLGLARPWLVAGASRVVTAIGEVPDAAAREMMVRFARGHLADGLAPSEALAAAKRAAIDAGGPGAEPRVWAAFVLHGLP